MSKKSDVSKYFWHLDNELPKEFIDGYLDALRSRKSSQLKSLIELLSMKVPLPPKAYLTSSFIQEVEHGPTEAFLTELGNVLSRMEYLTHLEFGGRERP